MQRAKGRIAVAGGILAVLVGGLLAAYLLTGGGSSPEEGTAVRLPDAAARTTDTVVDPTATEGVAATSTATVADATVAPTAEPGIAEASAAPTVEPSTTETTDPIVVAAGDIACGAVSRHAVCEQQATSDVVISLHPDAVLALGDTQYECGEIDDYTTYFEPTWGRFKGIIHPAIGNHEYQTENDSEADCPQLPSGAPGYWTYFGDASTPLQPGCRRNCGGYYSFDVGTWHIIALNNECSQAGGCGSGSPQEKWLREDLAAHPAACTLAFFHEPRWGSGSHGSITSSAAFWDALYQAGADVVLNGHEHDYERFAPQNPGGELDIERGIREFVVGTGGRNPTGLGDSGRIANSEVFNGETLGVLKLTLHPDSYDWRFVPVAGSTFTDGGSGRCH